MRVAFVVFEGLGPININFTKEGFVEKFEIKGGNLPSHRTRAILPALALSYFCQGIEARVYPDGYHDQIKDVDIIVFPKILVDNELKIAQQIVRENLKAKMVFDFSNLHFSEVKRFYTTDLSMAYGIYCSRSLKGIGDNLLNFKTSTVINDCLEYTPTFIKRNPNPEAFFWHGSRTDEIFEIIDKGWKAENPKIIATIRPNLNPMIMNYFGCEIHFQYFSKEMMLSNLSNPNKGLFPILGSPLGTKNREATNNCFIENPNMNLLMTFNPKLISKQYLKFFKQIIN